MFPTMHRYIRLAYLAIAVLQVGIVFLAGAAIDICRGLDDISSQRG